MAIKPRGKNGGSRPGAGRKPGQAGNFHPTPEQRDLVAVMASMGVPEQEMCRAVRNPRTSEPISSTTLRKIFRGELDKGFVQADAQVAASLFKNATTGTDAYPGGNPVCQIFWLKCRNRWQQDPAKNPPPLPEISEEIVDMVDFGRRLAFTLAAAAAAADGPEEEPA